MDAEPNGSLFRTAETVWSSAPRRPLVTGGGLGPSALIRIRWSSETTLAQDVIVVGIRLRWWPEP